jgi:hypothetical protein
MGLDMGNFRTVRTIGDFISARIAHVGFKTLTQFAEDAEMARPTLTRVLKSKDAKELSSYRITLERLAKVLRFQEWSKLVDAWRDDDVLRGIGFDYHPIPTSILDGLRARAAIENSTLDEWLARQASLSVEVHDAPPPPDAQDREVPKRKKGNGQARRPKPAESPDS